MSATVSDLSDSRHLGVLRRYREFLPVTEDTPLISLGEGETPLVESVALAKRLRIGRLFFKLEGCNPTGSFKDRGMVVAVAKAMELKAQGLICASTGNTAASAAAYGARAGIPVILLVPEGYVAIGKLAQALAYGARVVQVRGSFDDALRLVRVLSQRHRITVVNSINEHRLEGQKTAAFEVCDALGHAPDVVALPVGNAGNITAYWRGFREYRRAGRTSSLPRMFGFQAEGAAPIVRGHPVSEPRTIATAIRIGNPASWKGAEQARDESGGLIDMVSDEEISQAYQLLASQEGIFVEPASAAGLAGLRKLVEAGREDLREQTVVCVLTGTGLKDPEMAVSLARSPATVDARVEAVEKELGWTA